MNHYIRLTCVLLFLGVVPSYGETDSKPLPCTLKIVSNFEVTTGKERNAIATETTVDHEWRIEKNVRTLNFNRLAIRVTDGGREDTNLAMSSEGITSLTDGKAETSKKAALPGQVQKMLTTCFDERFA